MEFRRPALFTEDELTRTGDLDGRSNELRRARLRPRSILLTPEPDIGTVDAVDDENDANDSCVAAAAVQVSV